MRPSCHRNDARRCGVRRRSALRLRSGLNLGLPPAVPASAQTVQQAQAERPAVSGPYAVHIADAARRFRIPAHWIAAVLRAESAGDPRAVSSAGAMGLMQVMPGTWAELRERNRLGDDPFDARDNIMAGTAYLREMLDRYKSIGAMLAAYNAGPGRYDEYLATGRALPAETRAYVAALAPILGGEPLPEGAASPPPVPADWRDAPLFVGRSLAAPTARSLPRSGGASVDPAAVPSRDDGEVSAQGAGLFAPLAGAGDQP